MTKSIGIPYQSLGELTHTPALTKPKEIECDELWTASTDRSSTSLEDTAAGPCQTKPDLTESLRAVGKDNKVRDNLLPLGALHGEIVIPNKRAAPIWIAVTGLTAFVPRSHINNLKKILALLIKLGIPCIKLRPSAVDT